METALMYYDEAKLLFGVLLGGILSWFIARHYYRRGSRETPDWAEALIAKLPSDFPSEDRLKNILSEFYQTGGILESGSNSDGEWFRYKDGWQICKANVEICPSYNNELVKKHVTFPQDFSDEPFIHVDGSAKNVFIAEKSPNGVTFEVKSYHAKPVSFLYKAEGNFFK